jgi:hypothetical protein
MLRTAEIPRAPEPFMGLLSERKVEIVRSLVEAAPDSVVGGLHSALVDTGDDSALFSVRQLVETEIRDRRLRNAILAPIAPMCVGDGRDLLRAVFPFQALPTVWRALKTTAPEAVADAAVALIDFRPGESSPGPFDALTRVAANAIRNRSTPEFSQVAEICEAARPGGADLFANCLDLGPVVRAAVVKLPDWITHSGEDTTAGARLAYKDSVRVAEDSGPLFFEMLSAQLPHPWMILRIISAVMDKPTERYLADSEMVIFGERVVTEIDESLLAVSKMDLDGGPEVGRAAGRRVELITLLISELETCVELSKEHGWGHRLVKQKKSLAGVVESHLRNADKIVLAALPMQPARIARLRKEVPKLNLAPDAKPVRRSLTLLSFVKETRSSANYGGFAAARGKLLEKLGDLLDNYVEEVLDHLRVGDAEDEGNAYAFLEVAADISRLVRDEKAAELIRRRAAAVRNEPSARTQAAAG